MTRRPPFWPVAPLAALCVGAILVERSFAQTAVQRPKSSSPIVQKPKPGAIVKSKADVKNAVAPTPAELWEKIEKLEGRAKELEKQAEATRAENTELKSRLYKLERDLYFPSGQQGLKLKAIQKSFWNRIPNDAWLIYYQY